MLENLSAILPIINLFGLSLFPPHPNKIDILLNWNWFLISEMHVSNALGVCE